MRLDLSGVLAGARQLWRSDRAILLPLSALFVFLPQFAVLLLVPEVPEPSPGMSPGEWGAALEPWTASYGGWYLLATLLPQYGALALVALYMPPAATAGRAMARATRLFLRALLAGLLVTVPSGIAALMALSVPALALVVTPAIVYLLARTTLANPIILAERGTGAIAAVIRSWQLTRGLGLALALLVGGILIGGQALRAVMAAVDAAVRAGPFANPVLLAMIDAAAAGFVWVAMLALALVQVVLYRRLAR